MLMRSLGLLFLPSNSMSIKFLPSMASSSSIKVVAEYAKSNRSSCKKCTNVIPTAVVRLGLISRDPRGFDDKKWYHFHCFPLNSNPLSSAESIEGFSQLKGSDQESLRKLVSEVSQPQEKVSDSEGDKYRDEGKKESASKQPRSGQDGETELEERNPKKEKTSDAANERGVQRITFSNSDIKEKYKDAKLLPKWKAFRTIIFLERDDGLQDSRKIAAFDFDGCLAKTSLRRVGADAWSLMYPSIPEKLQSLYNDGYKLVIFTNESNIDRWKNKRQVAVDSKIGRLDGFIKRVKVPIQVFIACGFTSANQEDPFRKPKPGMWHIMEQQFNSGIQIDMDQSFYVGDAAGRPNDHSDADIKFAQAIGLKFYVPEEYLSV